MRIGGLTTKISCRAGSNDVISRKAVTPARSTSSAGSAFLPNIVGDRALHLPPKPRPDGLSPACSQVFELARDVETLRGLDVEIGPDCGMVRCLGYLIRHLGEMRKLAVEVGGTKDAAPLDTDLLQFVVQGPGH